MQPRGLLFMPKLGFVEPMECCRSEGAEGSQWTYELKLDGYRLEAFKSKGRVSLYSRGGTDMTKRLIMSLNPSKFCRMAP